MRKPAKAIVIAVPVVLMLGSGWIVGFGQSGEQPVPGQRATAQAAPDTARIRLQQRVSRRRAVLDAQEFRRLQIIDRLEFKPEPPRFPRLCFRPRPTAAGSIDPHRSLFVHDRATLDASGSGFTADFSLTRTLEQIGNQLPPTVPGRDAVSIFKQFWDTQNPAPGVTSGPHCTDNGSTINGFPITCPRNEGREALGTDTDIKNRIQQYKVLALVNRLDLAHQGWRNCGEYRIIYGRSGGGIAKNLIIFEAVLPNPKPGCREGCVPIAEFWKSLSAINDPVERAKKLEEFFYKGLPGFRPVVHVNHYSANGVSTSYGSSGSGQIRTNQFLQTPGFQPWLLKEFKTVIDCGVSPCAFAIIPISVKVNPHGPLWNEDNADLRAVDFQADTLAQTASLASGTLTGIGYSVDLANDAGQSMSLAGIGFVDNYRDQMNAASATSFRLGLPTGALTADQMANRALTQSCAGCHQPRTFGIDLPNSIGPVLAPVGSPVLSVDSWPDVVSAGFVHVDIPTSPRPELAANPAAFPSANGQEISPALLNFFLPERKNLLLAQLDASRCFCVPRFRSLDARLRSVALNVETRVHKQFADKFEALDRKLLEAEVTRPSEREFAALLQERGRLIAERDKVLTAELSANGITLPDAQMMDLKAQPMKLKAGSTARGDNARVWTLRAEEVNKILRQEPPRRTVTGSFRSH